MLAQELPPNFDVPGRREPGERPELVAEGDPGACGEDWLIRKGAAPERLPGKTTFDVAHGDGLRILTLGGGAWGRPRRP